MLSRYTYNASQKDSYICRERLRARKREKESSSVRAEEDGKVDLREKEETADGKSEIFCRHESECSIHRIFTHMYALTRVVSAVRIQVESRRLNEF